MSSAVVKKGSPVLSTLISKSRGKTMKDSVSSVAVKPD
jgi:hypothetical protein